MDAFDIALLMANQDSTRPLRLRYGTVEAVEGNTLEVVPDGQDSTVPAVRCCNALVGNRIVLLTKGPEWLAVGVVGGECPYGVGDIMTTRADDHPEDRWRGTRWIEIENRSILGAGTRAVGSTGGEEAHTLSIEEMPSHRHIVAYYGAYSGWSGTSPNTFWTDEDNGFVRDYNVPSVPTGGSAAHNNMHPYYVAHLWLRTE